MALPVQSITTKEYARTKRMMVNQGGEPFRYDPNKTPYSDGIMDALDHPMVRMVLVKGNTRSGKALALHTPIPTPTGWTTMGDLSVGDWVLGADGKPCLVSFATEVQHDRLCYRVTFSDGSEIIADAEHLWQVEQHVMRRGGTNGRRSHDWPSRVLRTADMVGRVKIEARRNRFRVRNAESLDLPSADLPLDPYVLGCWLGDGTSRAASLTCAEGDSEILDHLRAAGLECAIRSRTDTGTLTVALRFPKASCGHSDKRYDDGSCPGCRRRQYERRRSGLTPVNPPHLGRLLGSMCLIQNKHVPPAYLRASTAQRLALLQGLMDTDGTCSPGGSASFTASNPRLADAVFELAASLGLKPSRRTREAWCYVDGRKIRGVDATTISFRAYADTPVFRLSRKAACQPQRAAGKQSDTGTRRIVDITPVASEPVRCIQVDNADHLFLAGRAMIPTHNTVAAENFALKRWTFGPATNVIWFVQDEDSLNDYIDERGDEMLRIHPEINEKVNWGDRTTGRKRKNIGRSKLFYRPATSRALRMKAAPLIVGDEIDAWTPKVRDAAPTLITSRQEEFGSAAKAFLASHADAGPDGGIDLHLRDSLMHLWWVRCPHCHNAMSPAQEAEDSGARMTWNVKELIARAADMERSDFLESVQRDVRLCCPHDGCHATFDAAERIPLMAGGMWLQPHQRLMPDGTVQGDPRVSITMGFVIHAFMAPFVKLGETARDWAAAMLEFEATGKDTKLKEVIVKKLGETYLGAKEDEIVEGWKVINDRLRSRYRLKTVPAGVRFLTAFVDVQGDRFEVRVIGWSLGKESWLIDAYSIKQWPGFGNIDPGGKLSDWDIIEQAVLTSVYPLADNDLRIARGEPPLFLPIARTMVDAVGVPGVTTNARAWLSNLMSRTPGGGKRIIDGYRIALVHGASSKKAPLYGKPVPVEIDDVGRQRKTKVFERYPNVHELKRIISRRMRIAEPGPGRMHYPERDYEGQPMTPRFLKELTAERFRNNEWVPLSKRNETWDAWVMCEVARETLKPDRAELWENGELPEWADPRPRGQGIDSAPTIAVNPFDRLSKINQGIDEELRR